ncbi:anti-sigma factor antagonist [Microtetraspora sp. NBRC 13810]|uniref:STAS domain-containing protein n=1 Tax=Microtetraspora sp. NBRC 13810 TaxID=3030990 RepID=UPI0024A3CBB8|nr:STAS domain-containing protein [Microtetraspora sp. NBRC 13810]GLW09110.1 anti-sigma factor antagonist [Microtetraspora sp. NBRC 13810]
MVTARDLAVTLFSHPTGPTVLTVAGELDFHTTPRLRATVEEIRLEAGSELVIDLSGLTYCDSTGIPVFVAAYHRAQAAGAALAFAGLNPDLTRVFGIVGLDQILSLHPTLEAAVAAVRSGG